MPIILLAAYILAIADAPIVLSYPVSVKYSRDGVYESIRHISNPPPCQLFNLGADSIPYLELGKPNPAIPFTQGPCATYGRFTADNQLRFDEPCVNPWEFMATGTGITGLTIGAGQEITGQINHSGDVNESGYLGCALGRFRIFWQPLSCGNQQAAFSGPDKKVRMEQDLRKSVIRIMSDGGKVKIRVEVRAHMDLDVIQLDFSEESEKPLQGYEWGGLIFQLEKSYPFEARVEDQTYLNWHINKALNSRCYGTAIAFDIPAGCEQRWAYGGAGLNQIQRSKFKGTKLKYTMWIVAGANVNGFEAWHKDVTTRLKLARESGGGFVPSHEEWWKKFWEISQLEFPGDDGSHLRHLAAFSFYRYYLACSANRQREVPLTFMNTLFSFQEGAPWSRSGDYCAIETYQSWFGATRTGDLNGLANLFKSYIAILPEAKKVVSRDFGHDGAVLAYNMSLSAMLMQMKGALDDLPRRYTNNDPNNLSWQGNLWMLLLACDYADLSHDDMFAHKELQTWATEVVTFFREHYPNKTFDGKIDFTPSNCGESYFKVENAADLIAAMKALLPRLIAIGESYSWDKNTIDSWRSINSILPILPRGRIIQENGKLKIVSDNLLAPARNFNPECKRPNNRQSCELESIWPAKLMLRNSADRDLAIRSYYARNFQHLHTDGWNMDIITASCLGLKDDVKQWWPYAFDCTFTFPCGLAQEDGPMFLPRMSIGNTPSMHSLGTGIASVLEMLLQDYPDLLIILPCWEPNVPVRFKLFSPYAGKVFVDYDPKRGATVSTERPIKIEFGDGIYSSINSAGL